MKTNPKIQSAHRMLQNYNQHYNYKINMQKEENRLHITEPNSRNCLHYITIYVHIALALELHCYVTVKNEKISFEYFV